MSKRNRIVAVKGYYILILFYLRIINFEMNNDTNYNNELVDFYEGLQKNTSQECLDCDEY